MREFIELVSRVADADSSLLVLGETGVGKERLARAIHAESSRAGGPFVSVNCGALPESLLDSELFGHEKGAFTGAASTRRGRFELAGGGTIFLDEIGEMPPHLQVKLLTVLQRREVRRLGSERPISVDVRVISATNRDLRELIQGGDFREDLYFRLNVVMLEIPPLRERREDIPELTGAFIRRLRESSGSGDVAGVSSEAMEAMLRYPWPGNVRELINAVERALLLSNGSEIRLADLPAVVRSPEAAPAAEAPAPVRGVRSDLPHREARKLVMQSFERQYFSALLRETRGHVGDTAARAGINPKTLYEKMRALGLRKEDFRGE